MITSLLYVSRSLLQLPEQAGEVDDIVAVARSRNAELDVTGALVFTDSHFAQVLEGSPAALDELMSSIRGDRRHHDVQVTLAEELRERRFPDWRMAYAGPSLFVAGKVKPLLDRSAGPREERARSELLIQLMQEFVDSTFPA